MLDGILDFVKGHGREQAPDVMRVVELEAAVIQTPKKAVVNRLHHVLGIDTSAHALRQLAACQFDETVGVAFHDLTLEPWFSGENLGQPLGHLELLLARKSLRANPRPVGEFHFGYSGSLFSQLIRKVASR
jgi:hypothetical protein